MSKQILNERVLEAAKYLPEKFSPTPEKGAQYIFDCLDLLGITNSDQGFELLVSEHNKFGYAREIFVEKKGIPIVIFSKIWAILRNENTNSEDTDKVDKSASKVGQMSDQELLRVYGPNCPSKIEEELKKRSKGRNVIAFETDRKTINIDVSLKFLKQAKVTTTPSEFADGNGNVYAVYPVGSFPSVQYDICPISGEILIEDYSSELGKSWSGVSLECRQFLHIAHKNGIRFSTIDLSDMIDICKDSGRGLKELKRLFPKITLIFDQMKSQLTLPALKSTVEDVRSNSEQSDSPFKPIIFKR
jgi:hypothetical protein